MFCWTSAADSAIITPAGMCCFCCRVIKEMLAGDASTRLEGPTAIDVPALTDRDYKLSVYSYTTVSARAQLIASRLAVVSSRTAHC
jgi:hypothetical protein